MVRHSVIVPIVAMTTIALNHLFVRVAREGYWSRESTMGFRRQRLVI